MSRKLIITLAIVFALAFVGWKIFRFVALRQITGFLSASAPVQLTDPDVFFLGVQAAKVSGVAARLPVEISDVICRVSVAKLLMFSVTSNCQGKFLDGIISINSPSLGSRLVHGTLTNATIEKYPLASLAGLHGGQVDLTAKNVHIGANGKVDSGTFEFQLRDLSLPIPYKLNPPIVPLPITIPAIKNLDIALVSSLAEDQLNLSDIRLASSLGSMEGSGTVSQFSKPDRATMQIELQITLTKSGSEFIGPWLRLLQNSGDSSPLTSATISISGLVSKPRVVVHK